MEKKQLTRAKVNVVVRVRPTLKQDDKSCVAAEKTSVEIFNHRNIKENIKYEFGAVYDKSSTQQQVYTDCVRPKLLKTLNGQNVSIFAYGPTGAGKTHTMLGSATDPGIIPRVINGIFQQISEESKTSKEWRHKVVFSFLEIYNEKVIDLLEPKENDLPIREDGEKNIFIPGLAEKEIHSFDDFKALFGPASNNRTVAATKLNDRSSRSHSILMLKVTKMQQFSPFRVLHGKMYLIDLAGSEDNRRTGNKGIRLKESGAINKSLFTLGEVVDAINAGLPRIPYRNSKLTRLLQDSIGGSCHSVMITNIAPEERYYYDTYCTLNFASKSKKIVNNTHVRESTANKIDVLTRKIPYIPEEGGVSKAKRPKLDAKIPEEINKPPDPAPFLRTDLRRQVNKRLEKLEQNLLNQMSQMVPLKQGKLDPDVVMEIQRQIDVNKKQLVELASHTPPATPKKVLTDKTNVVENVTVPETPIHEKKKALKRSRSSSEVTCSPLFAKQPRLFRKKGFRSTASASSLSKVKQEDDRVPHPEKLFNNPELQEKMNTEFLEKLNTCSVKELQSLHTVGAKRAKLIHDWRENYGVFSNVRNIKSC
ncbi:hypothetical protein FSP39_002014 [Pinctada imbricata]|uniref:Kinesin-like protein n=1 Tax=Pinctada imbricata TaxID=66713 RepID=A0AA89BJU5_PINIB|nr:hypothetical protein FSP39_002014 [Pinctada imbricata]